jgi:hypothetical protein
VFELPATRDNTKILVVNMIISKHTSYKVWVLICALLLVAIDISTQTNDFMLEYYNP